MEGGNDAERLIVLLPSEDDEAGDAEFAEERFAFLLDIVVVHGRSIHSDRILRTRVRGDYFLHEFLFFHFNSSPIYKEFI